MRFVPAGRKNPFIVSGKAAHLMRIEKVFVWAKGSGASAKPSCGV
jgi:hypothetical protein